VHKKGKIKLMKTLADGGIREKSRTFTTGQMSGLTGIGRQSLYRYVKIYGEFFSETARQHKQGRRWTHDDILVASAIRALHHEKLGEKNIREKLKSGWKLSDNEAWSKELQSRLIDTVLEAYAHAEEISRQAIAAINDLELKTQVAEYNNKTFAELWIGFKDLQEEYRILELELRKRGMVPRQIKQRWYGEIPVLYLAPVKGSLKDFKVEE
jgi:DNA-binding transcriptional MerR regulator